MGMFPPKHTTKKFTRRQREIVHQMKEQKNGVVVTKCGESIPYKTKTWTAWQSDVTCDGCLA